MQNLNQQRNKPSLWKWTLLPFASIGGALLVSSSIAIISWLIVWIISGIDTSPFNSEGLKYPMIDKYKEIFQNFISLFVALYLPYKIAPSKKDLVLIVFAIFWLLILIAPVFWGELEWQKPPEEVDFLPKSLLLLVDMISCLSIIFTFIILYNRGNIETKN